MNTESKSAYGPAFLIRLGVLAVLLLGIGGAFAFDRLVLLPAGKDGVDRIVSACDDLKADSSAIRKAAGREPSSITEGNQYTIEDYEFGRILPNLPGYKVTVVLLNGKVAECFRGGISDADRDAYLK